MRLAECILVMKVLPYESMVTGMSGFVVTQVPLQGDVIRRGIFWNIKDATTFAEAIAIQ
jgi:hypothetical protein